MAAPSLTVTLSGPNAPTSVTLRATAPDTSAPVTIPGVVHTTQAGNLVTYRVGPPYWSVTLQLTSLTNQQKDDLESFFRANFGEDLTYTDENGNAFDAQFAANVLPLKKSYRDSWDVEFQIYLSAVLK